MRQLVFLTPDQLDQKLARTTMQSQRLSSKIWELIDQMYGIWKLMSLKMKSNAMVREIEINVPINLQDALLTIAQHTDFLGKIAYHPQGPFEHLAGLKSEYQKRAEKLQQAMEEYNQLETLRWWLVQARKEPDAYAVLDVPPPLWKASKEHLKKALRYDPSIYQLPPDPPGRKWVIVHTINGKNLLMAKDLPTPAELLEQEFIQKDKQRKIKKQKQEEAEDKKALAKKRRDRASVYKKALPIYHKLLEDLKREIYEIKYLLVQAGKIPVDKEVETLAKDELMKKYKYEKWPDDPTHGKYSKNRFIDFYEQVFQQQKTEKEARRKSKVKSK